MPDQNDAARLDQERRDLERTRKAERERDANQQGAQMRGSAEKERWENEGRIYREEVNKKHNLPGWDPVPGFGGTPMFDPDDQQAGININQGLSKDMPGEGLYRSRDPKACYDMNITADGYINAVLKKDKWWNFPQKLTRYKETLDFAIGCLGVTKLSIDWNKPITAMKVQEFAKYLDAALTNPEKPLLTPGPVMKEYLKNHPEVANKKIATKGTDGKMHYSTIAEKMEQLKKEHSAVHDAASQKRQSERAHKEAAEKSVKDEASAFTTQNDGLKTQAQAFNKNVDELIAQNHTLSTAAVADNPARVSEAMLKREIDKVSASLDELKEKVVEQKEVMTKQDTNKVTLQNDPQKLQAYEAKCAEQIDPRERLCNAADANKEQLKVRLDVIEQKLNSLSPNPAKEEAMKQLQEARGKLDASRIEIDALRQRNAAVPRPAQQAQQQVRPPNP